MRSSPRYNRKVFPNSTVLPLIWMSTVLTILRSRTLVKYRSISPVGTSRKAVAQIQRRVVPTKGHLERTAYLSIGATGACIGAAVMLRVERYFIRESRAAEALFSKREEKRCVILPKRVVLMILRPPELCQGRYFDHRVDVAQAPQLEDCEQQGCDSCAHLDAVLRAEVHEVRQLVLADAIADLPSLESEREQV